MYGRSPTGIEIRGRTYQGINAIYYPVILQYGDTRWTTAIHGLTAEDTNDALCFEEAWESIAPKLKDLPLVAHNSPFDEGCLKAAHEVYDLAYPKYSFYCTCRLSRKMYPFLVNHQLQTVAAHCGYDLTRHHNAMADAYACAHIALTMMREKEVDTLEALMASCYSR